MNLPEIPKTTNIKYMAYDEGKPSGVAYAYAESQLKAYGEACYAAAIEDAAKAELAEMVEKLIPNDESPFASSCCPICGVCMPHSHWPQEVVLWLQHQAARFVPDWPAKMVIRMGGDESEEIAALKSKIEYQDDMLRDASNSLSPADWYNWYNWSG